MIWKVYSVLLMLLLIGGYSSVPEFRSWEYADFIITCIAFFGFTSFAFGVRVLNPLFWKCWLLVAVIWDFCYNMFVPSIVPGITNPALSYLMLLSMISPEYLGLYLYGFKNLVIGRGGNK